MVDLRNVLSNCILTFGLMLSCILSFSSLSIFCYNVMDNERIYSTLACVFKDSIIYGAQICKDLGPNSSIRLKLEVPTKLIGFTIFILNCECVLFDINGRIVFRFKLPSSPSISYVNSSASISYEYIFIYFYSLDGKIFVKL
ncbi:MAG: hypothetical protein QW743_07835 [Candidatus Methanomethylicia archaeon]